VIVFELHRQHTAMAHELTPKTGRPALSTDEIVRRLQASFKHVELDVEKASRQLRESMQYMARTSGPHYDSEDIERARRAIGRAVYVTVSDDINAHLAYLSFLLEPEDETIFIGYESGRHEETSRELRGRLVRVLDYHIELV
jgi:hypothetical protein